MLMDGKRILVTGATGFIGSKIFEELSDQGYDVVGLARKNTFLRSEIQLCDLTDKDSIVELLSTIDPFDIVIHCAAIAHGSKKLSARDLVRYNHRITKNLVDAIGSDTVRWIFLSSIDVYGDGPTELTSLCSSSQLVYRTPYGRSKFLDEKYLVKNVKHVEILRLPPVYSEKNRVDVEKRVYLPTTRIKMKLMPPPTYSFCRLELLVKQICGLISNKPSRSIYHLSAIEYPSQSKLIEGRLGFTILIPVNLLKKITVYLPKEMRLLVSKLFKDTIIKPGKYELK